MKFSAVAAACLSLLSHVAVADTIANVDAPAKSRVAVPSTFQPPQVFQNENLVHIISLEKNYAKEFINVVIKNTSPEPQDEYYVPFTGSRVEKLGGFEVKDKKDESLSGFTIEAVEFDTYSEVQYYRIRLPAPLPSESKQTISISFYHLNGFTPLPAAIEQSEKQYLVYTFSAYAPSVYPTLKQKTEVKLPSTEIPEYTKLPGSGKVEEFPQRQGTKLTYGPFFDIPAGAIEPARVRYEFTKPVTYVSQLERDVEVSHWGGNIAFEDRYTLHNYAANLSSQFNRVEWARAQFYKPETTALKELKFPLQVGSKDAYFTDVIGNVSTSRFRSNRKEALLEIKPRYPVFGGWNYPFTIGWNVNARRFLKKVTGDTYVLNVPFLEGPKQSEGVQYGQAQIRILLPEGAENVKFHTSIPTSSITGYTIDHQKTYLDTIGRTVLTIKVRNLVDEFQNRNLIVSYDYSFIASLRKPVVIFSSSLSVFVAIWALSKVNVKISRK